MRVEERIRWETRLASKLRIAEDCLQRALDQLEEKCDHAMWSYINGQVDKAHDAVIDALGAGRVLCPQTFGVG